MRIGRDLVAAGHYLGIVFAIGFLLGAVRVTLVVPWVGERMAELAEMPLMFVAIHVVAGHVVRWHRRAATLPRWPVAGAIALCGLVTLELVLSVVLPGRSVEAYLQDRDPVSGSVYVLMLLVFALMPWWRSRTVLA